MIHQPKIFFYSFLTLIFFVSASKLSAQTIDPSHYPMSFGTASLINMGSANLAVGPNDSASPSVLIKMEDSFQFYYAGLGYSNFCVSPDGWIRLGQKGENEARHYGLPNQNYPIIAPLWGKATTDKQGNITYLYTGNAPNRILVIQWQTNVLERQGYGSQNVYQAWLHESTGQIDFVYQSNWTYLIYPYTNNNWAYVMLGANIYGNTNAVSFYFNYPFNNSYLVNYPSYSTVVNSFAAKTKLSFKPAYTQPYHPASLYINNLGSATATLNWIDSSTTETFFNVQISTDGVNFIPCGSVTSTTGSSQGTPYSFRVDKLNENQKYYFRVTANTEGGAPSTFIGDSIVTHKPSLSGTKKIPGDFATITAALQGVRDSMLKGAIVFELQKNYTSKNETFPIRLSADLNTDSIKTITIKPAADATGLVISNKDTNTVFIFDQGKDVIIDGRAKPGDTIPNLTIRTDTMNLQTILFLNGSNHDTLRYCNIKGNNWDATRSGLISLGNTNNNKGNSNIAIQNCDLTYSKLSNPLYNLLLSRGTMTAPNAYNLITGNHFHDFTKNGVWADTGNTNWTIEKNSFYRTNGDTETGGITCILVNDTNGNSFNINNNYFGGTLPYAAGNPFKLLSWIYYNTFSIRCIAVNCGHAAPSNIQGNLIKNLSYYSGNLMQFTAGKFNIGTIKGNVIGSADTSHTILIQSYSDILSVGGNATGTISNNIFGGIITYSALDVIVNFSSLKVLITNNIIGNTKTKKSFLLLGNNYNAVCNGIHVLNNKSVISNNLITGINCQYQYNGIAVDEGYYNFTDSVTVSSNTIYGITARFSAAGIATVEGAYSGTIIHVPTFLIKNNIIHSLCVTDSSYSTTTTSSTGLSLGVSYQPFINYIISGNYIHNLSNITTGYACSVNGIMAAGGNFTVYNNMISIATDSSGNNPKTNAAFQGIIISGQNYYGTSLDTRRGVTKIFHNTIYIGGTETELSDGSLPLSIGSVAGDSIMNNIIVNTRQNIGWRNDQTVAYQPPPGNYNYNIYYRKDTFQAMQIYDRITGVFTYDFKTYQRYSKTDGNSVFADPYLVNPEGDVHTINLHIKDSSIAEGNGWPVNVPLDFDGQQRSNLSPVDIGADAGNYIPSTKDLFPPQIMDYDTLPNTASTSARNILNVKIYDKGSGIPLSGSRIPRIWFRRSLPTTSSWVSLPGTLTSGTTKNSVWSFSINYPTLGVTPAINDQYQYYIVAQDNAGNLGYGALGAQNSAVDTMKIAPATPYSYSILKGLSGVVYAGSGQKYNSLTNSGGLFEAVNNSVITGDVTCMITSDISETGKFFLGKWIEDGHYKIKVVPADTFPKTLYEGAFILYGANDFTIDGSFNNDHKRHLIFNSSPAGGGTSTTGWGFIFISDASHNTIKNIRLQFNNQTCFIINPGKYTGNSYDSISNNLFYQTTGTSTICIESDDNYLGKGTAENINNTISGNEFRNVYQAIDVIGNNNGGGWNISGNSFYKDSIFAYNYMMTILPINFSTAPDAIGNNYISGNYLGGSKSGCGGSAWLDSTVGGGEFDWIRATNSANDTTFITNNTIRNIRNWYSNSYYNGPAWTGIHTLGDGTFIIRSNNIGSISNPGSIRIIASENTNLIYNQNAGYTLIDSNVIGCIIGTGIGLNITAIYSQAGKTIISNNIIGGNNAATGIATTYPLYDNPSQYYDVQNLYGIFTDTGSTSSLILNNLISNLYNAAQYAQISQSIGIYTTGHSNTIQNNTVYKVHSCNFNIPNDRANAMGIYQQTASGQQNIIGNKVSAITNGYSNYGGNGNVIGIYYDGSPGLSQNSVSGNFVHNLDLVEYDYQKNKNNGHITGILGIGNALYSNNMISLGTDTSGKPIIHSFSIIGLEKLGKYSNSFLFNSIYIGGSKVNNKDSSNTYPFFSAYQGYDSVINNIFYNNRTNAGPGGTHYALGYQDAYGLQLYNNIIFKNPAAHILASINYSDIINFNDPKLVEKLDNKTIIFDPNFKMPAGNDLTTDLHLMDTTIAEGTGRKNAVVTTDYDGETRSLLTPVDIGADAQNGVLLDTTLPVIKFIPLSNTSYILDRKLTATIYDSAGIPLSGINAPDLYYKKNKAGKFGFVKGKFLSGTARVSTWTFTIPDSSLNLKLGDSIYYFVVAQDNRKPIAKIASLPGGIKGTQVDSLTAYALTNFSYKIIMMQNDAGIDSIISPTSNVCEGKQSIQVRLRNFGSNILTSTTINWAINSKLRSTYLWNGMLKSDSAVIINIGSDIFQPGKSDIKIWTSIANAVLDSENSNDTSFESIIVNPNPLATVGSDTSICKGNSISIGASSINGHAYLWSSNPSGFTDNHSSINVTPGSNIVYNLTETITTTGCNKTDSVKISVNPSPTAIVGSSRTICNGSSVTLGSTPGSGLIYLWNSNPTGFTSTIANPTVSPTITATYNLTVTNVSGCSKTDSVMVDVNPAPDAYISSISNMCSQNAVILGKNPVSGDSYLWSSNPTGFSSTLSNPTVSPTATIIYRLTETITATGCSKTDSIKINYAKNPVAKFLLTNVCPGDSSIFTDQSDSANSWSWNFGDSKTSVLESPNHLYINNGTYIVKLKVANSYGCADSISKQLTISPCVWPGDANNDRTVDMKDFLAVGIAYGTVGHPRPSASITWSGQVSADWDSVFASGVNYKHADCNGDSIIDYNDTLAISANYGKSHSKSAPLDQGASTDPQLKIQYAKDTFYAGDTLKAEIILGSSSNPIKSLYGLKFSLNADPLIFETDKAFLKLNTTSFGVPKTELIGMAINNASTGQIDLGITRITHKNASGYGNIATLYIPVKSKLPGEYNLNALTPSNNLQITVNEKPVPLYFVSDTVMIKQDKTGIQNLKPDVLNNLTIYPNPFQLSTIIEYYLVKPTNVNIILCDITGKQIGTIIKDIQVPGSYKFDILADKYQLQPGIYLLKFMVNDGVISRQLVKF